MKWIAAFIALLPLLLTAQSSIQGHILDAESGEGLAFATILYGRVGTYANADGFYRLGLSTTDVDSVRISFIGYSTFRTTVSELRANPTVRLQPAENRLGEVLVRGGNDHLYALLRRCRRKLLRWPSTTAKGYFQLATTRDGTPVELMQNYYNINSSGRGIMTLGLKAGRVAVHPADSLWYRTLGTTRSIARLMLTEATDDFADHPLQLSSKENKRQYELTELPEFSDANTIHIRFDSKREGEQLFNGELWVDAETAELRKLILRQPELTKVPLSPISPDNRIGPFDVEFIYTFGDRRLQHLQWRFAYDHYIYAGSEDPDVDRIAADCSIVCFDPEDPFFPPRIYYSRQYGDYRKLAFFPYDTLFWKHAPQVPLTEQQRRQMRGLGMTGSRIDYGRESDTISREVSHDGRNVFWSPDDRYVHTQVTPKEEIRNTGFARNGTAPVVQIFLDAFPIADSLAFNSVTFLDVYATQLTVKPSDEYSAALNIYFDLCELTRRDMMAELRAGPADLDFVNRTYDKYIAKVTNMRKNFFQEVRRGKKQKAMERYNKVIADALGVDNFESFELYDYSRL